MSDFIEISVNGEPSTIRKSMLVMDYLHHEKIEGRFLIVINDDMVPKSSYEHTQLNAGDRIDIMSPISGG
jgi:sulfur carrier protein